MSVETKPMPAAKPAALPSVEAEEDIPDPKRVKLLRPKEGDGKLADTIPVAPVAPQGPIPRLVHDNERAPAGVKRFAIRCKEPLRPKRYVLAGSQGEAETYYRRYAKLNGEKLIVVALPD